MLRIIEKRKNNNIIKSKYEFPSHMTTFKLGGINFD